MVEQSYYPIMVLSDRSTPVGIKALLHSKRACRLSMTRSPSKSSSAPRRRPRQCRQCPDQPLKSQCIHSKAGRAALAAAKASMTIPQNSFTPIMNQEPETPAEMATPPLVVGSCAQTPKSSLSVIDPILLQSSTSPSASECPSGATVEGPCEDIETSDSGTEIIPSSVAVENEISSTLLQADSQDSNSESGISDPAGNTSDASGSSNRSRTRITAQNPVYGHVEGAMAGPHILEILRPSPLRTSYRDQPDASKRFNREIKTLIARSERLAEETGCWLMILAQHSNAKMQAIHYTSPRLRTDALQDAGSIVREFARITQALKTAKRQEAVALAMRLALVEEEKARVKEELANQASELAAAHALLAGLGVPIPSPD